LEAQKAWTDLYIYPGFEFRAADVLLKSLRRPRSSHIVLTAAFAGKDFVMRCYDGIAESWNYELICLAIVC
jgi:S-adenosylmethionine:tRNA ribosyltransferase-isomerase